MKGDGERRRSGGRERVRQGSARGIGEFIRVGNNMEWRKRVRKGKGK